MAAQRSVTAVQAQLRSVPSRSKIVSAPTPPALAPSGGESSTKSVRSTTAAASIGASANCSAERDAEEVRPHHTPSVPLQVCLGLMWTFSALPCEEEKSMALLVDRRRHQPNRRCHYPSQRSTAPTFEQEQEQGCQTNHAELLLRPRRDLGSASCADVVPRKLGSQRKTDFTNIRLTNSNLQNQIKRSRETMSSSILGRARASKAISDYSTSSEATNTVRTTIRKGSDPVLRRPLASVNPNEER